MQALTSVTVKSNIESVFETFTDIPSIADRIPGIQSVELLSDPPVGEGTRWRETRVMFNKESTEEMWVSEFTLNRSYTVEAESCGAHFKSRFVFTAEDDGTRVDSYLETQPLTFAAKFFKWLGLNALMRGMMKKAIQADMDALKRYAES